MFHNMFSKGADGAWSHHSPELHFMYMGVTVFLGSAELLARWLPPPLLQTWAAAAALNFAASVKSHHNKFTMPESLGLDPSNGLVGTRWCIMCCLEVRHGVFNCVLVATVSTVHARQMRMISCPASSFLWRLGWCFAFPTTFMPLMLVPGIRLPSLCWWATEIFYWSIIASLVLPQPTDIVEMEIVLLLC